jgi:hypothetical protein
MKRLIKVFSMLDFIAALATTTVFAQSTNVFDEYGHGSLLAASGNQTLSYTLAPDPTGGLPNGNVLIYSLMFSGTTGDLLLFNPSVRGDPLDTVIRFNGNSKLIFYADSVNGYTDLADTPGPPDPLLANQFSINEQNTGQIAYYAPKAGQPGYDASNPNYVFYIDYNNVPEPSPSILLMAGLGVFIVTRLRNLRKSAVVQ